MFAPIVRIYNYEQLLILWYTTHFMHILHHKYSSVSIYGSSNKASSPDNQHGIIFYDCENDVIHKLRVVILFSALCS